MIKLLVIGGLPDKKRKFGYGGATVLMQNFVDFLDTQDIYYRFIQTNKFFKNDGSANTILNYLYFFVKLIIFLPWCNTVMFNFSDHATVYLYPKLVLLSKFFRKKIVLRKFGGSLGIYLSNKSNTLKTNTYSAINKADLILLETQASILDAYKYIDSKKITCFPNNRCSVPEKCSEIYSKHFVFISHILDEKGVADILDVAKRLPSDFIITLYGPIKDNKYHNFNWLAYNVTYGGILNSDEVVKTLSNNNILLLTSYREGQPGIIIEAMSCGLPCISTNVGGIPELVNDMNGILINPGDKKALEQAILNISQESYLIMRKNAIQIFSQTFESKKINTSILKKILNL